MRFQFNSLKLQCQKSVEFVEFSSQITHVHGQISSGKSSIVRLIDFCMGGHLERTPAISRELVSVQLSANIAENEVLLERLATGNDEVQVTWRNVNGEGATLLAPIRSESPQSIWKDNVHNLSDLLLYLMGIGPIYVRKSKHKEDSELVRLSFRDFMWYCYLEQDLLDSSFYHLTDPFRQTKSRDVMRFVTGFFTERMNDLQIQLDEVKHERLAKLESAKQIQAFLDDFGYGTEMDVAKEIAETEVETEQAKRKLVEFREGHQNGTHFADDLRERLRNMSAQLEGEEVALAELRNRIEEQKSLRAELISAKFKMARANAASVVLTGVSYEYCPKCGLPTNQSVQDEQLCPLCKGRPEIEKEKLAPQAEMVRRDLTSRIEDLSESIERHSKAYLVQEKLVRELKSRKVELDAQLSTELRTYDSAYLAQSRELERQIATLEERKRGLEKTVKLPQAITNLISEAGALKAKHDQLAEQLLAETRKLTDAELHVQQIEEAYLTILLKVGVPGIDEQDRVTINRRTWIPQIESKDGDPYTFYDAGSGGKKTLINACYALAVHKIAAEQNLPLPSFLMIDTPMKNIGEDVNENIFRAFYECLYDLASGSLLDTQFIIVDKEFFKPEPGVNVQISDRFMSPNNPLISYYHGP